MLMVLTEAEMTIDEDVRLWAEARCVYNHVAALAETLFVFEWQQQPAASWELVLEDDLLKILLILWVADSRTDDDDVLVPLTIHALVNFDLTPTDQIRAVIHDFVTHEADETMIFDGVRVFDPHA